MRETPEFTIRKHRTKKPHFDLILRLDGETKHWTIPNGIPEQSREKKIAVEESHNGAGGADEKSSGERADRYGGGRSELWDRGDCEITKFQEYKLVIRARGEKFRGNYLLFVPGWGRWTKRRLWVMEKIRGNA